MTSTEQQREDNRRRYPQIAAFVDELRAHFGAISVEAIRPKRNGASRQPEE